MADLTQKANDRQVGGDHYQRAKYQHWDWAMDNRLRYFEGCITKYVTRWRRKDGLKDLQKSLHFTEKMYEGLTLGNYEPSDRRVLNISEFFGANELSRLESEIIARVVTYRSANDLHEVRNNIRRLIFEAEEGSVPINR